MFKLCTPALVYVILSVIALGSAMMYKFQPITLIVKGIFIIVWTWLLNYLCSKNYETLSWILLLMPFILVFLILLLAWEVARMKSTPANSHNAK